MNKQVSCVLMRFNNFSNGVQTFRNWGILYPFVALHNTGTAIFWINTQTLHFVDKQ
jgi:hypothetical protein